MTSPATADGERRVPERKRRRGIGGVSTRRDQGRRAPPRPRGHPRSAPNPRGPTKDSTAAAASGGTTAPTRWRGSLGNRALASAPRRTHLHTGRERAHVRAAAGAKKGTKSARGARRYSCSASASRARFRSAPGPAPDPSGSRSAEGSSVMDSDPDRGRRRTRKTRRYPRADPGRERERSRSGGYHAERSRARPSPRPAKRATGPSAPGVVNPS